MTLWVVRAGKFGEEEQFALDNGVAVIGWAELPDLSKIPTRQELKAVLEKTYPNDRPRKISVHTGQTWRFSHEISPGDLVALPLHGSSAVAVGRVKGAYHFVPDAAPGVRHRLPVKWIRKDIPRTDFDQDILYAFGGLMTVFQVRAKEAESRVEALLSGRRGPPSAPLVEEEEQEGLIDLESVAADQIRKFIGEKFKGHEFAYLIAAVLKAQGYELYVSPPGPDGGVDILAGTGPLGFEAPRIAVQVKSSDSPLGANVVRELLGVMSQFKATQGLIVCWGGFRDTAIREARQQFFSLRLWDSGNVVSAVQEHYEKLPGSIQAELPLKRIWALVAQE